MRRSLFDILGERVRDAVVVDLFGGTGSLAFEALSRGAAHAYIFETDARCAEAIRRNMEKLDARERVTLMEESAFGAAIRLESIGRPADIVFVDPPYVLYEGEEWDRLQEVIAGIPRGEGAVVIVEHRTKFEPPGTIGALTAADTRKYGGTSVTFYS